MSADPRIAEACELLYQASQLVERATAKLESLSTDIETSNYDEDEVKRITRVTREIGTEVGIYGTRLKLRILELRRV